MQFQIPLSFNGSCDAFPRLPFYLFYVLFPLRVTLLILFLMLECIIDSLPYTFTTHWFRFANCRYFYTT